jgi:hypothetical protein
VRPSVPPRSELTRQVVLDLAAEAERSGDELDLSGYDLRHVNLGGEETALANVVFGRHGGLPPAGLVGAVFRGASLQNCSFAHVDLTGADFRGCRISDCDFRYAIFHHTTLSDATLVMCDLYRASFQEGTVMANATFELVSLNTTLAGVTGLTWASFARTQGRPPLVTESEDDYRKFLERTRDDRPKTHDLERAMDERLDDAARTYRQLSGLWTSTGQFRDAGHAYAYGRRLERQAVGPGAGRTRFQPLLWLWLWFVDLLCGFGESLVRIVPWLLAVALLPGIAYWLFGGVNGAHGIGDDLLFSASQMTASAPSRLTASSSLVEWFRVGQTVSGVALLGLFGFVLGNEIRSS